MESLDVWTVCIGALAFVGLSALLLRPLEAKPRRAGYRTYPRSVPRSVTTLEEPTARSNFTADQLKAVMAADYFPKRILSATEARVMYAAEDAVREAGLRWRIMAQVALGEVLRSESLAAFHAINAKRVDLLVVCEKGMPLAAIEYQGSGHHLGNDAVARDAIKREALRKAGVRFIEIGCDDGPADVRREIGRLAFARS